MAVSQITRTPRTRCPSAGLQARRAAWDAGRPKDLAATPSTLEITCASASTGLQSRYPIEKASALATHALRNFLARTHVRAHEPERPCLPPRPDIERRLIDNGLECAVK